MKNHEQPDIPNTLKKLLIAMTLFAFQSAFAETRTEQAQPNQTAQETHDGYFLKVSKNYEIRVWSNGSWMARPKDGGVNRQDGDTMAVYCIDGVKMLVSNENRQSYATTVPGQRGYQACSIDSITGGEISMSDIPKPFRNAIMKSKNASQVD